MKLKSFTAVICVLFTSNCTAALILDGTLDYGVKRKSMWAVQSDVNDGVVTPVVASSLPASGSADFEGHFAIYDGATGDRELLFGNVAMNYDFAASGNQLTGKLNKIMLVDDEGQRVYGTLMPKIQEKYSGSVAISGNLVSNSVPLSGSGNIVDGAGASHSMTFKAEPSFYIDGSGNYVLSSPWATGTLTDGGGTLRNFSSGYMGARQTP